MFFIDFPLHVFIKLDFYQQLLQASVSPTKYGVGLSYTVLVYLIRCWFTEHGIGLSYTVLVY